MNWTFRANKFMAYHVAYLAKAYDIPPSLIIINDQTRIHLVPTVGECTWESRGSKHIHIFGIENKWQVIMVVSSFLAKIYLPLQIIFIRTIGRTSPLNNQRRAMCVANGWDLTYNENHWSNFDTTKHFVENVMVPYHQVQIELLGLQTHQKLVWLLEHTQKSKILGLDKIKTSKYLGFFCSNKLIQHSPTS